MEREYYHCTIDLLFGWFGISCMTTDNFCFYLQKSKPVKQEVKGTMILLPLVFPALIFAFPLNIRLDSDKYALAYLSKTSVTKKKVYQHRHLKSMVINFFVIDVEAK
jgi:hypothetical protein